MAGSVGFYSHDTLTFPTGGGTAGETITLPETNLWDGIPNQSSVESCSWDVLYPDESNLLSTSTTVSFHSRPSLFFSDLSDSYMTLEMRLIKDGDDPIVKATDQVVPANFMAMTPWKDMQIHVGGKPIHSCYQNLLWEAYLKIITETSNDSLEVHIVVQYSIIQYNMIFIWGMH